MTSIPGASRYLTQATYSAKAGSTFSAGDILSQSGLGSDLLEASRSLRINGLGISNSARLLNKQVLNNTSTINTMFSLSGGVSASIENAQVQIKALQSSTSISRLTPDLRAQILDQSAEGVAADTSTGTTLDEEV